ncbi:hypothetical protein LZ30DRAFT_780409 [Colletotrichum cereale]|nr:hypothetical protein LZ30DRAFT_780409 [Colletotrichum cereale]
MWFSGSPSRRLSARDYCDGVDGKAFWPGTGDTYYLDSSVLLSWFAGKASSYTNTTAALWNVWLQDARYDDKAAAGAKGFRDVIYSRNFTYTVEGDNWWWVPTDVCNQTVVSCMWTVPRDFRGTGSYVVVAVREAAAAMTASTAISGSFTIVASADPMASAAAASATETGASGRPAETAVAPSTATDGRGISAGAAAGIACGVAVVLLGLVVLLWFFWRKRRSKKLDAAAKAEAAGRHSGYEKPELDGQTAVAVQKKASDEIDSKPIHVAELDGQQTCEKDGVAAAAAADKAEKNYVHVEASAAAELGAG